MGRVRSRRLFFDALTCFFLPGLFPETQVAADAAVHAYRAERRELGAEIDAYAAWSFAELILACESRLRAMEEQMRRLFDAGLGLASGLWPDAVVPNTVSRLARWLEAGVERLGLWRASAARAGAETALRFVVSWYPGVDLDRLAAQRAGAADDLATKARRIAGRASYLASFAPHDEFVVERTEDGEELPTDALGLLLDDPDGSSAETGAYDDEADADGDALAEGTAESAGSGPTTATVPAEPAPGGAEGGAA